MIDATSQASPAAQPESKEPLASQWEHLSVGVNDRAMAIFQAQGKAGDVNGYPTLDAALAAAKTFTAGAKNPAVALVGHDRIYAYNVAVDTPLEYPALHFESSWPVTKQNAPIIPKGGITRAPRDLDRIVRMFVDGKRTVVMAD